MSQSHHSSPNGVALLSLGLVALTALWAVSQTAGAFWHAGSPSALAIIGIPRQLGDTLVIAGLNLNEAIGADISALTDLHLASLGDGTASTPEGSTRYRQTLRFAATGDDAFSSGTVQFGQDDSGAVGNFLVFSYANPVLEYEVLFDQGLTSRVESGRLTGLEDSGFAFMGMPASVYRASVTGNALDLRIMTGGGDVQIRDSDITDSSFERATKVNGRNVNSQARIQGTVSGNQVRIDRIAFRVLAYSRAGGDMYVAPLRGVRQYLREPETLLNPSFDIIFAGMLGGAQPSGGGASPGSGNLFFDPVGGQRYDLIFTNLAGQTMKVPFVTLVSGTPTLGNGKQDLVVSEGSSTSNFNIDPGDYFVVSSANDWNGVSNVVVYSGISRDDHALYFDILGGGRTAAAYDTSTGRARLTVSGFTHDTYVDLGSTDRIVVDQNHDGIFTGAAARIVAQGSAQIEPGASSTTLRIARRLFNNPPSSDETTTINFVADGSKITAQIPSQSSVTLKSGNDRISRGMTTYGVQFTLDDRRSPSKLAIDIPRSQRAASVQARARSTLSRSTVGKVSKGGQAGALVVVTFERERFLPGGSKAPSSAGVGVND